MVNCEITPKGLWKAINTDEKEFEKFNEFKEFENEICQSPHPGSDPATRGAAVSTSVAATVHEACWCPLNLLMRSKPQMWLGLKIQSPSTLRWRLHGQVSHIRRFENNGHVRHTNRPHGQSPLPARPRPAS